MAPNEHVFLKGRQAFRTSTFIFFAGLYETNSAQTIARALGKSTTPPVALMAHASNDLWMASVSFAWLLPGLQNLGAENGF